jgi:hypothetical protein
METMCKIHKQDELNSSERITSDAMLHKGLEGFDYHRSMVGMRLFFHILLPPITINYSIQYSFDILVLKKCTLKRIGVVSPM